MLIAYALWLKMQNSCFRASFIASFVIESCYAVSVFARNIEKIGLVKVAVVTFVNSIKLV